MAADAQAGSSTDMAESLIVPATSTTGKWQSPSYAKTSRFTEIHIEVGSKLKTRGTLTLPQRSITTPCHCVIMLGGSGPCDQDSTVGVLKPFKDLAWGLATRGVSTIRFDKISLAHPDAVDKSTFTLTDEYVDQAVDALRQAQAHPGISNDYIYFLGHSLGCIVVPKLAEDFESEVCGMILLAAPSRPLYRCAISQMQYVKELLVEQENTSDAQAQLEQAITDLEVTAERADNLKSAPSTPAELLPFGLGAPYWLDFRQYNPIMKTRRLGKPTMLIYAMRDYQVTTRDDLPAWRKYLGHREHAWRNEYLGLNHYFVYGEGRGSPQEYSIPGNVAEDIVRDIAGWLKSHR